MTQEASAPKDSGVDAAAIVVVALVGTLILIASIVALQALYYHTEDRQLEDAYAQPNLEVAKVRAEQEELLSGYSRAVGAKGRIRIPVQRAMELTARELAAAQAATSERKSTGRK